MILHGNPRGGARDLAAHLMKAENERVEIVHMRGFASDTLEEAFLESYAISRGTMCKQHFYSLSINPPKGFDIGDDDYIAAALRVERQLNLTGQPRAIVRHWKHGDDGVLRSHAHVVWCRIDPEHMKAIALPYHKLRLREVSRDLHIHHDLKMPPGLINSKDRDKRNFTHQEWQQCKRAKRNAREVKGDFQDAWALSDSRAAFANALEERGYILACGDRRGFVAVDGAGEVFAVSRYVGIWVKQVRAKLGDAGRLPNVEQAREIAAALFPQKRAEKQQDAPIVQRIKNDPAHVLSMLTEKNSTFSKHDIAKTLSAYISEPQAYQNAFQTILASKNLLPLAHAKDRFTTKDHHALETKLLSNARDMAHNTGFAVSSWKVNRAIHAASKDLRKDAGVKLSHEQQAAIRHVTGNEQLSCVIGVAGAGKSTMLNAARQAWESSGHRVFGAALAGKAAKGLEASSGIKSRTLASYELSWKHEHNQLQCGDVLVIDEAGMIGSKQMARFINEAKDMGVKLVLVGDAEQLQPIEAGSPFKAITEKIKPATLHDVHRQKEGWQRQASKGFALTRTGEALETYRGKGRIDTQQTQDEAIRALVQDYMQDFGQFSQLALAHRKADVRSINNAIRDARKEAGELQGGKTYKTTHGRREFAPGDRLLFTRNERDLGVQNGMLGTVTRTTNNRLTVKRDDAGTVIIPTNDYEDFDHGYATTIHKSQGATVDRSYVLASRSMDRHLTYVAMTRHKHSTKLYASDEEFKDFDRMTKSLSRAGLKDMSVNVTAKPVSHETEELLQKQAKRHAIEEQARAARLRGGVMGLIDKLTGRRKETLQHNAKEAASMAKRNENEMQDLQARQNQEAKNEPPHKTKSRDSYIKIQKTRAARPHRPRNRNGPSFDL